MAKKFRMKAAGGSPENNGAMGKPTGNGLARKTMGSDTTVSSQSTDDHEDMGQMDSLANSLVETDFMSVVNDQNVEKKPQGVKTPGSSKPTDGYTKPLSSSLQDKIAESMDGDTVDEDFKEGYPLPTIDYNDGQGMEVETGGSKLGVNEGDGEGELTMEDAFQQYAGDKDQVNYDEFANHADNIGYERPLNDDMMGLMDQDKHNLYEPNGVGGYGRTPIMLTVDVSDLPGQSDCDMGAGDMGAGDAATQPMAGAPQSMPPQPVLGGAAGPMDGAGPEDEGSYLENEECMESEEVMEEETVEESSVTTSQLASAPSMTPNIKKSKVKKAGNAATAVDGMKNMGKTMNRKLKNDTSSNTIKEHKNGYIVPQSIQNNVNKIVKAVNEALAKVPSAARSSLTYRVIVESKTENKKVATKSTKLLAEAAVDAEELAVIGHASTHIEVALTESKKQTGVVLVALPKLTDRKPAINESGLLFRFKSLAQRYATSVIGESVAYAVEDHPFGALIKTDVKTVRELV